MVPARRAPRLVVRSFRALLAIRSAASRAGRNDASAGAGAAATRGGINDRAPGEERRRLEHTRTSAAARRPRRGLAHRAVTTSDPRAAQRDAIMQPCRRAAVLAPGLRDHARPGGAAGRVDPPAAERPRERCPSDAGAPRAGRHADRHFTTRAIARRGTSASRHRRCAQRRARSHRGAAAARLRRRRPLPLDPAGRGAVVSIEIDLDHLVTRSAASLDQLRSS